MASTSVSNVTTSGCSWSITGLQAPFNEYLSAGVALSSVSSGSSSPPSNVLDTTSPSSGDTSYSASGSVSGLSSGTQYTFYGFARSANGLYYPAGSDSFTTQYDPPSPPSIFESSSSENTITILFSEGVGVTSTQLEYGTSQQSTSYKTTSSSSFYLTGLLYDTTYFFRLRSYNSTSGLYSSWTSWSSRDTEVETPQRPSNFSWTYTKTSGQNFKLTATEWNNFTSRINSFRTYKSLSTASFTTAVNGNNFTATMFNQARNALNSLSSYFTGGKTIPSTKSNADDVKASYLNDLVSAMNSIQ